MILHENHLPADDSHEISCLICYFWKCDKMFNCRLLQIIGGALRVNYHWGNRITKKLTLCIIPAECIYWKKRKISKFNQFPAIPAGDKKISILHLSWRTSDLHFPSSRIHMHLCFKSVCNKKNKGVICNTTSSTNSSQSPHPVGRVLWKECLILSRFHS